VLILSLALVVVEFLAILWFFTNQKLQNISGNHAATCRQRLTAFFPHFNWILSHYCYLFPGLFSMMPTMREKEVSSVLYFGCRVSPRRLQFWCESTGNCAKWSTLNVVVSFFDHLLFYELENVSEISNFKFKSNFCLLKAHGW
jgi:hypothetical protein